MDQMDQWISGSRNTDVACRKLLYADYSRFSDQFAAYYQLAGRTHWHLPAAVVGSYCAMGTSRYSDA
jgi:hypothetical protein